MADGSLSYIPGGYIAAGRRLGLSDADVQTTLWLATHTDYYRGKRGPSSRDPLMSALRKHAALERGGWGGSADGDCDEGNSPAAELLGDAIARTPRRRSGTLPRPDRRAEEDQRKAREAHQLWFCGADWRMDAANDDEDDDNNGAAE